MKLPESLVRAQYVMLFVVCCCLFFFLFFLIFSLTWDLIHMYLFTTTLSLVFPLLTTHVIGYKSTPIAACAQRNEEAGGGGTSVPYWCPGHNGYCRCCAHTTVNIDCGRAPWYFACARMSPWFCGQKETAGEAEERRKSGVSKLVDKG